MALLFKSVLAQYGKAKKNPLWKHRGFLLQGKG